MAEIELNLSILNGEMFEYLIIMGEKEYKRVQKVKKEDKRVLFLQIFKKEYNSRK